LFLIPTEQTFGMRLHLPHLLVVHCDLFHDFGSVHLCLQDILLHSLADRNDQDCLQVTEKI